MLKRVMIISGESSGELYGSLLAKTLKERNPSIEITGVGGEKMKSAGVKLISKISSAFGITEAVKTYSEIKKTFKKVISELKSFNPQVIVLIDYPDFNMKVARKAKELGIKVLYYVSPQVWAWRKGRVNTLGKLVDQLAVILPFEEEIYRNANIPCEFIGHPILDEIKEELQSISYTFQDTGTPELKAAVRKELRLVPDRPVMTLMPGSRHHEIEKLLPVMLDVMKKMHRLYPDYQFVMPVAPNLNRNALSVMRNELKDKRRITHHASRITDKTHLSLRITNNSIKALMAADLAVIASGTSTLQAALLGIPMVVVYKLSPLTYFIGKLIIKIKHIALVNVILDSSLKDDMGLRVKELLQKDVNKENLLKEINRLINDSEYRNSMLSQFRKTREFFMNKNASLRVAEIIEELA